MSLKKKKAFATFNGTDYTYPELQAALFGTYEPLKEFALDRFRILEQNLKSLRCRSEYCRYFESVELTSGQKFVPNCKSWRCEKCRLAWGRKWSALISEQLEYTPATLLVNLTTAQFIDHQVLEFALRRFMRKWRKEFGTTEYIKVVEYNKKKTQPHFHLIFCCAEYNPPPMPKDWDEKLSWPFDTFQWIKATWQGCLELYAPNLNPTKVAWCQPVRTGPAAVRYAVGYVTGKSLDKNEEPDSTWKGRKLTYSRGFFSTPTAKIWQRLLERWFPDRPKNPVFGLVVNPDECEQDGIPVHLLTRSVKDKLALTSYYKDHQEAPPGPGPGVEFHQVEDSHQVSYEIIEPPEKLPYQRNFNEGKTKKAIGEMLPDYAVTRLSCVWPDAKAKARFIKSKKPLFRGQI